MISKEPIILNRQLRKIAYSYYRKIADDFTKQANLQSLPNYELISYPGYDFNSKEHYTIDHKISVSFGFRNNIPADAIGHISNLRVLSYYENSRKSAKCFVDEANQWIIDQYIPKHLSSDYFSCSKGDIWRALNENEIVAIVLEETQEAQCKEIPPPLPVVSVVNNGRQKKKVSRKKPTPKKKEKYYWYAFPKNRPLFGEP